MNTSHLLKSNCNTGYCVITAVNILGNTPVCEFKGDVFSKESLKHGSSQILQVGPDHYLGPSGGIDDYIRHSCNPNCSLYIVGTRAFLYARHSISVGSEITFDYSTSSTDSVEEWQMQCKCGSFNCRKIISGYYHLQEEVRSEYKKAGLIPTFLTSSIFSRGV